ELSHIGLLQLAGWLARWLTHWLTPGSDKVQYRRQHTQPSVTKTTLNKILIAKLSLHFTKTLTTPLGPQTLDLHGRIPT
ncbi:hypothetical protein Pcinc_014903, partial [Petrolisthes cinctipes]